MGAKKTGGKETGAKETGAKETGAKEVEGEETGTKAPGAKYSQEKGWKGDLLMGERQMDNTLPGDTSAGQNVTERIRHKNYSVVVIEGVVRRARVFVGDSIVMKTDRALNKGTTWWFVFQG